MTFNENIKNQMILQPMKKRPKLLDQVRSAIRTKNNSCHTFRHSFATHLLQAGYDIRTVQPVG